MRTERISKLFYRVVMGVLAIFCLLAALDSYGGYAINRNYFPNESHARNLQQAAAFLLGFVLLSGECWWLMLFRLFWPKRNEGA